MRGDPAEPGGGRLCRKADLAPAGPRPALPSPKCPAEEKQFHHNGLIRPGQPPTREAEHLTPGTRTRHAGGTFSQPLPLPEPAKRQRLLGLDDPDLSAVLEGPGRIAERMEIEPGHRMSLGSTGIISTG
jgi:hypothetical protein